MRLKLVFVFLLTVLIPTGLLVYFSLMAVRGEQDILESTFRERYQGMSQIVLDNIREALKAIPENYRNDARAIEPVLLQQTHLFRDEVMIFDQLGNGVNGKVRRDETDPPVYETTVLDLPYVLAVYEPYTAPSKAFEEIRDKIAEHVTVVSACALAILLGGFFTLGKLAREWRKTEIKSEFMSHLVHDLRRPLTSIRMFSEMLECARVPTKEKEREYHRIIRTESDKLVELANNVLDFSRIERGKGGMDLKEEDLVRLVSETVERFKSISGETHPLIAKLPGALPRMKLHADSLSRALLNLLSNAVKYSSPGSAIEVVLRQDGSKALLSVSDQGLGIPKKEQKKIFQEYYRGLDREVQNREGTGLGLALVKYAVLANKGKIRVNSQEGKGSEFIIELPL